MTFASVYEMFDPLTTVRKQRFWDWFSGDDLKSWWTQTHSSGGTAIIEDAVDGGCKLSTSSTAHGNATLEFNDKRPFDYENCVMIATITPAQTANTRLICSLGDVQGSFTNSIGVRHESGNTYYTLMANLSTETDSTVTLDTSKHVHSIVLTSSSAVLSIDGVSEATETTPLPAAKMQPLIENYNKGVAVDDVYNLHYFEAYNT